MKAMILALLLAAGLPQEDTLRLMFWNVENFFDWRCDSTSVSEMEFSARGPRRWTRKRFRTKADAIAKTILWAAAQEGGLPDAIGLAEVENRFVLRQLLQETALRKTDYRIIHFDSPDPRGIDVALLYRSSRLELTEAKPFHLYRPDSTLLPTRDILWAQFARPSGEKLSLLVNHHPSKFGGAAESEPRRRVAVGRLKELADSLGREGPVVAMGDFNDTPDAPLYRDLDDVLQNLAEPLHRKGEGSIKYQGRWELIDMFLLSERCRGGMKVLRVPFLLVPDKGFAGEKPFRTYSGPRYIGGVSDHCPIWLNLKE